jgi:hypothetical protein
MRSIILDELRNDEINKIREFFDIYLTKSNIIDLYYLTFPDEILNKQQKELKLNHGPYKISIEICKKIVKFELLVRNQDIHNLVNNIVTRKQLIYIYNFIDKIVKDLKLITC